MGMTFSFQNKTITRITKAIRETLGRGYTYYVWEFSDPEGRMTHTINAINQDESQVDATPEIWDLQGRTFMSVDDLVELRVECVTATRLPRVFRHMVTVSLNVRNMDIEVRVEDFNASRSRATPGPVPLAAPVEPAANADEPFGPEVTWQEAQALANEAEAVAEAVEALNDRAAEEPVKKSRKGKSLRS